MRFVIRPTVQAFMRLPELIETAHWLKTQKIRTRINTIGLGSLVWGRDITPELCAAVDEISVSLNCADKESWLKTVRPLPQYAEKGFDAVLEFIKNCLPRAKKVTVTTVDLGSAADARVKDLAGKLGVNFRLREFIKDASVHGAIRKLNVSGHCGLLTGNSQKRAA